MKAKLLAMLDTVDAVLDHRVTGLMLWVVYMGVQDMLKDDWVQTVLSSPASIKQVPVTAWLWILGKASLPVVGGIITYKSNTWASKGLKMNGGTNETKPNPNPVPAGPGG